MRLRTRGLAIASGAWLLMLFATALSTAGAAPGSGFVEHDVARSRPMTLLVAQTRPTQAAVRAQLLAADRRSSYRAPAVLLAQFAVFSRRSLRTSDGGVTVSHPKLGSLPFGVLVLASTHPYRVVQSQAIREIQTTAGVRFWVLPGATGLCLISVDPRSSGTTYGSCTNDLAQAEADGASLNVWRADRQRAVAGVVPDINSSIRVRRANDQIRTVAVHDGVYIVPTGLHHIYVKGLPASN
jgi:hypothetical protein